MSILRKSHLLPEAASEICGQGVERFQPSTAVFCLSIRLRTMRYAPNAMERSVAAKGVTPFPLFVHLINEN